MNLSARSPTRVKTCYEPLYS